MNDLSLLKEIPDPVAGTPPASPVTPPRFSAMAPSAVRSRTRRMRRLALGLSVAWVVAHLSIYGLRGDLQHLPPLYLLLQVGLPALLGALSLWLALAPGRLGLGLHVRIISALAVLGPLSFWLLAAGLPAPYADGQPASFWLSALLCMDITLAWAAAPLLLAALALRRAFPSAALWRSALVGAAVGLSCGAAINLHCPSVNPGHLVAGHGVPLALAALLGGLVVSRWARA